VLHNCLGIESDKLNSEDVDAGELSDDEVGFNRKLQKEQKSRGILGWLTGGNDNFVTGDTHESVKVGIYEKLSQVLTSCIYCWNHLELLNWTNYRFTRFGQFPHYQEHEDLCKNKFTNQ
jgi:hypothetical protein